MVENQTSNFLSTNNKLIPSPVPPPCPPPPLSPSPPPTALLWAWMCRRGKRGTTGLKGVRRGQDSGGDCWFTLQVRGVISCLTLRPLPVHWHLTLRSWQPANCLGTGESQVSHRGHLLVSCCWFTCCALGLFTMRSLSHRIISIATNTSCSSYAMLSTTS